MEVPSSQRGRDQSSPDRAKICRLKQQKAKPARKVQVVYYLSRNGLLEHPHFMELTLLPNQPLRLKDVFDRLMALRGSGMPLQYSWSSKRNYKSGYVWNDLALKDIIHPAEGGEYVLKGSELVQTCSERIQEVNVSNKQQQGVEANYSYDWKRKPFMRREVEEYEEECEEEQEEEEGDKTISSYTSSTTTSHSRCSRGVSTEELVDNEQHARPPTNSTKAVTTNYSPRGAPATLAEKLHTSGGRSNKGLTADRGAGGESAAPSRHSVLLQLIACGSSALDPFKGKHEARLSNVGTKKREEVGEEENGRLFGKLQSEEKEYFSGSLVESTKALEVDPVLNRSNSYNEQRKSRLGMEEVKVKVVEQDKSSTESKGGGGAKEKCIPRKKSSK